MLSLIRKLYQYKLSNHFFEQCKSHKFFIWKFLSLHELNLCGRVISNYKVLALHCGSRQFHYLTWRLKLAQGHLSVIKVWHSRKHDEWSWYPVYWLPLVLADNPLWVYNLKRPPATTRNTVWWNVFTSLLRMPWRPDFKRVKIQNKSISQNTSPNFWYVVQKC